MKEQETLHPQEVILIDKNYDPSDEHFEIVNKYLTIEQQHALHVQMRRQIRIGFKQ